METDTFFWQLMQKLPETLWVEGRSFSSALGDQLLKLNYDWSLHLEDTVKATVEPRPGVSEVTLKILQEQRLPQGGWNYFEKYSNLSNWVCPLVEVKVAPGEQLVAGADNRLHLRIVEDSKLHDWPDKHFDVVVPLDAQRRALQPWRIRV